jgi:DNA-binding transcriptional LysR family regulator
MRSGQRTLARVPPKRPDHAATLDLNLLRVLDVLLDERSVTAAAGRVHLSVPATSRALGRLRVALGDELLVRAGRELVLTPRALELRPLVAELLQRVGQLTESATAFDPAQLRRTFAVRANDGTVLTLGGSLLSAVAELAPGVVLRFLPEADEDPAALRTGLVDIDVGVIAGGPADIRTQVVGHERHVGLAQGGHPLLAQTVTARRFAAAEHVSASRRGRTDGPIDTALERLGLQRRVRATVGTMAAALWLVAGTELVAAVPASLAAAAGPSLGLVSFELPLQLAPSEYRIGWHARLDADPAHVWLRELIVARWRLAL